MSKSFGLPGLRIGWLVTKYKRFMDSFCKFKDYTTICSSGPSEILSIMALRNKKKIFKRNLDIINTNLSLLDSFFDKHSNIFKWKRPQAGPVAFPELTINQSADDFCKDLELCFFA